MLKVLYKVLLKE